ncbi:site-specific DNA-methyltransferase [Enterococcus faecalis]|uniref:site-specific DNA-methyltransferase n=1 Tax=Enterococcus TaxID=1350 RepID=UPI001012B5C7|nr:MULTISPECIES: site-specific DNA-methyltransferase [Enterococcus]MCU2247815.1 site-specific DNA-methyltransferase [Enterococcus faecalis]RXU92643.1 DNA methyltransferase [Enterococcus faecalis]TKO37779.1 site-specific DNA-methyltransferase [Enterococcus faecalis]TKO59529.1 site-specific DNA-methyltransferase [Enterococcus faecalis]TKO72013.1 site-specific DNA-methyltransferase [Enterococcus faecalis]
MDTRLMQQIKDILKEFPQYWMGEELQRPVVIDDLKNYDALLISALLKNQKIRENYSVKAGDVVIFKVQEFIDILRYKDYWEDSYTKYSNTIGLSSEGKYLQYNTDVVLDFPYKDCILEGGMTKEDIGKEEVFYNEVIARDEIDTLLAPKAFVNVKKYDADGEQKVDTFSDEDNLILKGNNLLALHSLKDRYAGKVKLIYIDPPYNTGGDSFKYNDRFNHSTWLTFMKNRLEVAKELLSEEGVIFVSIDRNEFAELKVLMDSIFKDSYLGTIINTSTPNGRDYGAFAQTHDYIHVYGKSSENTKTNALSVTEEKFKLSDSISNYYLHPLFNSNSAFNKENRPNLYYPMYLSTVDDDSGYRSVSCDKDDIHVIEVFPPLSQTDGTQFVWRWGKNKVRELGNTELVGQLKTDGAYRIAQKMRPKKQIPRTVWQDAKYSNRRGTEELQKLFDGKVFSFPKPEYLIKDIIEIGSDVNDLVLDFHMGSGTTASVAMKMNRRFIGIEQMDYINTVSVPRLQKVIEGEQGGISKELDWTGGGSFIYAELMELNQIYMNKIDQASTKEELSDLWDELDNNADLNFQLDKEKLTNELLKEHDEEEGSITFNDLTFEEQKEILKKALDKNQLYVPYSEIEDANVIISDNDKAFNHRFYNGEED